MGAFSDEHAASLGERGRGTPYLTCFAVTDYSYFRQRRIPRRPRATRRPEKTRASQSRHVPAEGTRTPRRAHIASRRSRPKQESHCRPCFWPPHSGPPVGRGHRTVTAKALHKSPINTEITRKNLRGAAFLLRLNAEVHAAEKQWKPYGFRYKKHFFFRPFFL